MGKFIRTPAWVAVFAAMTGSAIALEERAQGDVMFVTGGVGDAEIAEIKSIAPRYPLQILTADKAGQFVAGAVVTIEQGGQRLFEATLDGPYLLAKLKPGRYRVRATFEGRSIEHVVDVGSSPQAMMLNW